MATTASRLTIEEIEALPEEHPGDRHELIDGELFVTPVPLLKHQTILMNLLRALDRHADAEKVGRVYAAQTGVRLSDDNLLIPDILYISNDRADQLVAKGIDGPPDLVIEILSPGTRRRDLTTKRELYARFEVPEYWIVDPEAKTVTVLTLSEGRYETVPVGEDGVIDSRTLPGIGLTLDKVFEGVR